MTKKLLAEGIGTMVLVLMGCGAAVMNGGAGTVQAVLTIAFAFGLAVVAMAYTIGDISGCHINPAITLGVFLSGRMPAKEAIAYMMSQILGAFLGSALIYAIIHGGYQIQNPACATGANDFKEGMLCSAFFAEAIFSFVFVLVVLGTTSKNNGSPKFAGLIIGLTLVLVHIVCIPLTGTSVNPARSIGPAIFEGGTALAHLWVFILAPFVGAALAAGCWKVLETKN